MASLYLLKHLSLYSQICMFCNVSSSLNCFFIVSPSPHIAYLFLPCLRPYYLLSETSFPMPLSACLPPKIHFLPFPYSWLLQILLRLRWQLVSPWVWPMGLMESRGWREASVSLHRLPLWHWLYLLRVSSSCLTVPPSVVLAHHRQPFPLCNGNTSFPLIPPALRLVNFLMTLTSELSSCPLFFLQMFYCAKTDIT